MILFYKRNEKIEPETSNEIAMTSSNSISIGNRYNGGIQGTKSGNISNATLDNGTVTVDYYDVESPANITNTTKNSDTNNRTAVTNVIDNQ